MTVDINNPLIDALQPLVDRVRVDVTAVRRTGQPAAWTNQALTRDHLARHLNSGPARGVCPIREGESVTLVAILDFDSHKGEVSWPVMSSVVASVADELNFVWGLEPILFRSSGGAGVHLYCIFDEPQDAYSVRALFKRVLLSCGLRDGSGGVREKQVEVNPKQDEIAKGRFGSMVVLPLADKSELLELDDLSGLLVVRDRAYVASCWVSSPGVPFIERPVVERLAREPGLPESELPVLWAALDAIPNSGAKELDYDAWRDIWYGVHWATGGSQEGLDKVEEWSARSSKHVPGYGIEKVWNYADQSRAGGITAATVFKRASQAGWVNPATHADPDDDGFEVEGAAAAALQVMQEQPETAGGAGAPALPAVARAQRPDSWEQPNYNREKKTGAVIASVENAVKAIRDQWEVGMQVAHDTFRDEIMVAPAGAEGQWRNITDADIVRLRIKLEQKRFKSAPKELARDAMVLVADENQFDSARLWLDGVQTCWDGVRRVDTFLRDFFGCADTPYTRAVSRYIWTAMAGRVISPGCQADMAPILEGDQGLRKTSALAAMVPDRMFFTEIDLAKDDDTLARLLRGSLVGEISELRGLQTKDQESIKAWISRRFEKWVPKFKEFSTVFPRRCVLFGTTNRTDLLVDETGNRRWLPVHVTRADVEGIDAVRDQLWAEGAALFDGLVPGWEGGVAWQEAEELAKAEHDSYRRMDEWEAPVQAWLDGSDALDDTDGTSAGRARGESPFTVLDVLCGALGMSIKEVDSRAQLRCGAVLRTLGYAKHNLRVGGAQGKRWMKV